MDKTVIIVILRGMSWCSWLRHYSTSWKAMGSISDGGHWVFLIILIILAALWAWGQLGL